MNRLKASLQNQYVEVGEGMLQNSYKYIIFISRYQEHQNQLKT